MTLHAAFARLLLAASLSASFALLTSAATAQAAEQESPQARYRQAHEAIAHKEWSRARELLLPLWNGSKTYDVASSLAQVEYQLKNYADAATYMAFALQHVAPMESPQAIERMRRGMNELRTKVGAINVTVKPAGAEISLNGRPLAPLQASDEVFVEPGPLLIEARTPAGGSASQRLQVGAGEFYKLSLEIPDVPPISANAAASPITPAASSAPAPGDTPSAPIHQSARPTWPIYIGGAVTAVGTGMAIGFTVARSSAKSELDALRAKGGASGCADGSSSASDCRDRESAIERSNSSRAWANVGVAVGITGAVGTLGYVLFWPHSRQSSQRLQPAIVADSTGAAIRLTGTF